MTPRDLVDVPPQETRLVAGHVPTPTSAARPVELANPGATPGLATAAARTPTGPTLPDPMDAMTSFIAGFANQVFATPTAPSTPSVGDVPGDAALPTATSLVPTETPVTAPAPAAAPSPGAATAPSTLVPGTPPAAPAPGNPFAAPLSFDAAFAPTANPYAMPLPTLGGLPLLDTAAPMSAADAPYWLAPPAPVAPMTLPASTDAFQIEPVQSLGLRPANGTVFDPHAIRREFPILHQQVNGRPLVWLDNAATTQKPQAVIDRLSYYYEHENSNIHRAAHTLAGRATDGYESARETVRRVINAPTKNDIVYVRGTTEGINLIAQSWGRRNVKAGDEILLSHLEHHANIVPWQQLCGEVGAVLKVAPVDDTGQIILEEYEKLLGPKTRLVAFSQVSNALGTITPAKEMIELAHRHGAKVLLDGAQAISHMRIDVQALDCDFFVFSGHKVFGPTGIGAVFGKSHLLAGMPAWQGGGNAIKDVTFERTQYQDAPMRFEAGTGNIADAIGLGAALEWLERVGVENVGRYEHELLAYGTERLAAVPGLTMIGTAPDKAGVLSFTLAGQKTEEVSGLLDKEGIAVRSGHHCAQPILRRFGVEATVRASLAPYNTCEDLDALVAALLRLQSGR